MSISKTKNYLVLNHNPSAVGISTKHDSFLINGGTPASPGSLPLTFDEIAVVNSKSPVFQIGLLRFEPAYEADLYEALSIPNWQNIMTQEQIEEALRNPTMETSQQILSIENDAYFERVRGVMVGLRSAGVDIPGKVERMIEQRRLELNRRQRKTSIQLVAREDDAGANQTQAQMKALQDELAEMKAAMAALLQEHQTQKAEPATANKESTSRNRKADTKK